MNELYLLGVDIIEEVKNMMRLSEVVCTDGMTENELKAYQMGVTNVISALEAVVREDDIPAVDIPGLEIPTELSIDELEEYYDSI